MSAIGATGRVIDMQIQDPILCTSLKQRFNIFNKSQEVFTKFHDECMQKYEAMQANQLNVRKLGSDLQNQRITVPSFVDLEKKRAEFVTVYNGAKKTSQALLFQIQSYIVNLQSASSFNSPSLRTSAEEKRLGSEQPEFLFQLLRCDELCRKNVADLETSISQLNQLQQKFQVLINTDYSNYLNRFCKIADNKGQPLGMLTRAYSYVMPSAISEIKFESTGSKEDGCKVLSSTPGNLQTLVTIPPKLMEETTNNASGYSFDLNSSNTDYFGNESFTGESLVSNEENLFKTCGPNPTGQDAFSISTTTILVNCDVGTGNMLGLFGTGPGMSWKHGIELKNNGNDVWICEIKSSEFENFEFKIVLNNKNFEVGLNHTIKYGETIAIAPQFSK